MSNMKIEHGKYYVTKSGELVQMRRNKLPYYCFSAMSSNASHLRDEVWTDAGVAYHNDCGYNILREASASEIVGTVVMSFDF